MIDRRYTYRVEGAGVLTVAKSPRRSSDNRSSFRWTISDEVGARIGSGGGLNGMVGGQESAAEMMPSLLGFLAADGEKWLAGRDSGDPFIFNDRVAEWAGNHQDELATAESDLEELQAAEKYREELIGLVSGFEFERCEVCSRDVQAHIFAPDVLGNPHAYCVEEGARLHIEEST